jgi:hypothetical protein
MGHVGRQLTGVIKAATGERIVAFGRVGKSPENSFFTAIFPRASESRETSENVRYSATAF